MTIHTSDVRVSLQMLRAVGSSCVCQQHCKPSHIAVVAAGHECPGHTPQVLLQAANDGLLPGWILQDWRRGLWCACRLRTGTSGPRVRTSTKSPGAPQLKQGVQEGVQATGGLRGGFKQQGFQEGVQATGNSSNRGLKSGFQQQGAQEGGGGRAGQVQLAVKG